MIFCFVKYLGSLLGSSFLCSIRLLLYKQAFLRHVLVAQVSLSSGSFAENPAENLEENIGKRKRGVDPTGSCYIYRIYASSTSQSAHCMLWIILTVRVNIGKAATIFIIVNTIAIAQRRWCTFFKPVYFFPQETQKELL